MIQNEFSDVVTTALREVTGDRRIRNGFFRALSRPQLDAAYADTVCPIGLRVARPPVSIREVSSESALPYSAVHPTGLLPLLQTPVTASSRGSDTTSTDGCRSIQFLDTRRLDKWPGELGLCARYSRGRRLHSFADHITEQSFVTVGIIIIATLLSLDR
jgi:hypothetical protein